MNILPYHMVFLVDVLEIPSRFLPFDKLMTCESDRTLAASEPRFLMLAVAVTSGCCVPIPAKFAMRATMLIESPG